MAVINPFNMTMVPPGTGGTPNPNIMSPTPNKGGGGFFNNPLFLQYLAAAGTDLLSGGPVGANVNQITQQAITNKNYSKLLQSMLGDAMSPGTPSKMTTDGTKFKFETEMGEDGKGMAMDQSILNPSSSPLDISSADLAGLTPEMISQALGVKFQVEDLKRQRANDAINRAYKGALIQQALRPKDARTSDIKNFEFAKSQGFDGSFEDWSKTETTDWREYQKAVGQGYQGKFYDWQKEMSALGGGLELSEYKQRKEADIIASLRKTVRSAKYVSDLENAAREDSSLDHLFGKPDEYNIAVKRQVLEKLDSEIRNAYSDKEVERKIDGWYADGKLVRRNPYAK